VKIPILNSSDTYVENDFTVINGELVQDISDLWVGVSGLPRYEGICQGKSGGGESRDNTEQHTGSMANNWTGDASVFIRFFVNSQESQRAARHYPRPANISTIAHTT